MAQIKKNNNTQSNNTQIIGVDSENIVCVESKINLSDAKMVNILKDTYEFARKDARKFKIYKHYGIFFSIAFSLLVSLLTSQFLPLGQIAGTTLKIIFGVVCAVCFIIGFTLLIICVNKKESNVNQERDNAVKEIMNNLLKK